MTLSRLAQVSLNTNQPSLQRTRVLVSINNQTPQSSKRKAILGTKRVFFHKVLRQLADPLRHSNWGQALIDAWVLLRTYEEQTNETSKGRTKETLEANKGAYIEMVLSYSMDCYDGIALDDSEAGLGMLSEMTNQPFCLVYALDYLLMYGEHRADRSVGVAFGTLKGVAGPFQLSEETLKMQNGNLKVTGQHYWLMRHRMMLPEANAEKRPHHPQHFLHFWRVSEKFLPCEYVAQAVSSPEVDHALKRKGSPPTSIRIMTANFSEIYFESTTTLQIGGERSWQAKGLLNVEQVGNQVREYLYLAQEHQVSVLVLPELTIPDPILEIISDTLRSLVLSTEHLSLVIAGSFHKPVVATKNLTRFDVPSREDIENRATVFDRDGKALAALGHTKTQYVDLRKGAAPGVIEDIQTGRTVQWVDSPWGTQTVMICLDFAQGDGTGLPWSTLPLNWIWVPAMSKKVTAFNRPAQEITLTSASVVAVANQASADLGGLTLGGEPGHSGFVHQSDGLTQTPIFQQENVRIVELTGFSWFTDRSESEINMMDVIFKQFKTV
jgi:hypothetical protein